MITLFLILLIASPFLFLITYSIILKRKSFWKITIVHTIIFMAYMIFTINYSTLLTGHDEYGLGKIGLALTFIITHIVFGLAHAAYLKFKDLKKGPYKN